MANILRTEIKLENYDLEKWIWTEADFDVMGWHDCPIYAMKFDGNLSFDLDYLFKWNEPEVEGMPFTFWISPATLIFEDVTLFKVNFITDFVNGLEIYEISKSAVENTTEWTLETQEGNIIIRSKGFKQVIRRKPTLQFNQCISHEERGENYFSDTPEKEYVESKELIQKKKSEFEQYELAIKRVCLKKEIENLNNEKLQTKEFLQTKRSLNEKINELNKKLHGTIFERY